MQWFWCQLVNNTPIPVRVVVLSQFGQGHYYLFASQSQWVQFFPGQKSLTAFDLNSGNFLTSHTIVVNGSRAFTVLQQGPVYSWSEGQATGTPPGGGWGGFSAGAGGGGSGATAGATA